jgi:hypothetical protein
MLTRSAEAMAPVCLMTDQSREVDGREYKG